MIITKYITKYKFNKDISDKELRSYELELLKLLTDRIKKNKDY